MGLTKEDKSNLNEVINHIWRASLIAETFDDKAIYNDLQKLLKDLENKVSFH